MQGQLEAELIIIMQIYKYLCIFINGKCELIIFKIQDKRKFTIKYFILFLTMLKCSI